MRYICKLINDSYSTNFIFDFTFIQVNLINNTLAGTLTYVYNL